MLINGILEIVGVTQLNLCTNSDYSHRLLPLGEVDEADDAYSHNAAPNRWDGKLSVPLSVSKYEPVLLPTPAIPPSQSVQTIKG